MTEEMPQVTIHKGGMVFTKPSELHNLYAVGHRQFPTARTLGEYRNEAMDSLLRRECRRAVAIYLQREQLTAAKS